MGFILKPRKDELAAEETYEVSLNYRPPTIIG